MYPTDGGPLRRRELRGFKTFQGQTPEDPTFGHATATLSPGVWYVQGFDIDRQAMRTFRMDKMIAGDTEPGPDPYVADWSTVTYPHPTTVTSTSGWYTHTPSSSHADLIQHIVRAFELEPEKYTITGLHSSTMLIDEPYSTKSKGPAKWTPSQTVKLPHVSASSSTKPTNASLKSLAKMKTYISKSKSSGRGR